MVKITNELEDFSAIKLNGQRIGTVYLKRDLTDISEELLDYAGIIVVVLAASLLITLVTTSRFKRVLTRPISELVKTTAAVAASEDYSLRAKKITQDELGTLTDAFNGMLSQIEISGSALRDSEERFRVLFNSCNDGIAILDRDLNFVFANEAADMYWGMNHGPLTGKYSGSPGASAWCGGPLEQKVDRVFCNRPAHPRGRLCGGRGPNPVE